MYILLRSAYPPKDPALKIMMYLSFKTFSTGIMSDVKIIVPCNKHNMNS